MNRGATRGADRSTDSYLPEHGNGGYRVSHYDLDLSYRLGANRLVGRAVLSAVAEQPLSRFSLDLSGFRVERVLLDGRAAKFARRGHKLHVTPVRPVAAGPFTVEVRYVGNPKPIRGRWGDIGWDELTDGALVASQPVGAPSWFPCNDHPADKASYRIAVTTDAPYIGAGHRGADRASARGRHPHLGLRAARAHRQLPGQHPDRALRRAGTGHLSGAADRRGAEPLAAQRRSATSGGTRGS